MNILRLSLVFSLVVSVSVDAYAVGAGICPVFDDGTVLLGLESRTYKNGPKKGQSSMVWSDFGGAQDPNESHAETAHREFTEETAHYTFPSVTLDQVVQAEANGHYTDHLHQATGQSYRTYFLWIPGPKPTVQSIHQNAALANQNLGNRAHVEKSDWGYFDAQIVKNAPWNNGDIGDNNPVFGLMLAGIRKPSAQQFLADHINALNNGQIVQPVVQPVVQPIVQPIVQPVVQPPVVASKKKPVAAVKKPALKHKKHAAKPKKKAPTKLKKPASKHKKHTPKLKKRVTRRKR